MRILLITMLKWPWTLYRDANEYLIQIEDTKNSQTEKTLTLIKDISVQCMSQIYRAELPWSQCSGQGVLRGLPQNYCIQGYIIFAMLLCPFTLANNFDPSFILPGHSRYKHSYSNIKLFWIWSVLNSPTDNECGRSEYKMGINILLYTAILFIK